MGEIASPEDDPRLTGKQAAEFLGLKVETLATWRCRGGGPPFFKVGGAVRYLRSDLQAFMVTRKVKFAAELGEGHAPARVSSNPGAADASH